MSSDYTNAQFTHNKTYSSASPNLHQQSTSLARLTRGQGLRFRHENELVAVRVWQTPNIDHFLICFVVAADSATIHCITSLERISPTGTPPQVLPIETIYQPIISFFRMTEITKKASPPQGFSRLRSGGQGFRSRQVQERYPQR